MSWHNLASDVSNLCDIINTRQVLERIEELESDHCDDDGEQIMSDLWDADDREEWSTLHRLIEELRNDANEAVENGVILIRETYFADYIREFYSDCPRGLYRYNDKTGGHELISWDQLMSEDPFKHIDWAAVAEDERSGYSIFGYDGITYYYL